MPQVILTHWDAETPPARSVLESAFRAEGLAPRWWSNGPGDDYDVHSHNYHKVLYCASGSIVFRIEPAGDEFELQPGDRLDLPPGTPHSAIVGPDGVMCVEAPR
jgi:quercetin dioxygenase-like cupin family protein